MPDGSATAQGRITGAFEWTRIRPHTPSWMGPKASPRSDNAVRQTTRSHVPRINSSLSSDAPTVGNTFEASSRILTPTTLRLGGPDNSRCVESSGTMQVNSDGIVDAGGLGTGLGGRRRLAGRGGARGSRFVRSRNRNCAGQPAGGACWMKLDSRPGLLRMEARPQAGRVRDLDRQLHRRSSGRAWCAEAGVEGHAVSSYRGRGHRDAAQRQDGGPLDRALLARKPSGKGCTWRARGMDTGSSATWVGVSARGHTWGARSMAAGSIMARTRTALRGSISGPTGP